MTLLDVPALLLGASPSQLLSVYVNQTELYQQLTLNAPNIYQFLAITTETDLIRTAGVVFTGTAALIVVFGVVVSRVRLTAPNVALLATVFAILVPFFLPAMHERYFYLADALSVVVAFYFPRKLWPVPLLVQFASFFSYTPFLFGQAGIDLRWLAAAMLVALVLVTRETLLETRRRTFRTHLPDTPLGLTREDHRSRNR